MPLYIVPPPPPPQDQVTNHVITKMAFLLSTLFILFYLFSYIVNGSVNQYPFRNTSLPFDERVDDLVKRLTLDEIVLQMAHGGGGLHGGQPSPPIPRLGIKTFQWSAECLRGVAMAGNATSFPQAIGLAASFKQVIQIAILD